MAFPMRLFSYFLFCPKIPNYYGDLSNYPKTHYSSTLFDASSFSGNPYRSNFPYANRHTESSACHMSSSYFPSPLAVNLNHSITAYTAHSS